MLLQRLVDGKDLEESVADLCPRTMNSEERNSGGGDSRGWSWVIRVREIEGESPAVCGGDVETVEDHGCAKLAKLLG